MLDGVRRVGLMLDIVGLPAVRSSARTERHRTDQVRACGVERDGTALPGRMGVIRAVASALGPWRLVHDQRRQGRGQDSTAYQHPIDRLLKRERPLDEPGCGVLRPRCQQSPLRVPGCSRTFDATARD
jgi:hypothetical protein